MGKGKYRFSQRIASTVLTTAQLASVTLIFMKESVKSPARHI
jgi:hypothetical protein